MKYVETGKSQIVIDASRNRKRETTFLFSEPIYTIRHGLFFEKRRFDGSVIKTVQDVNKFTIGGILGYNFDVYKFDTSAIEQGTRTPKALLSKLRAGRLDFAIGYVEVYEAIAKLEQSDFLSGLGWIEIPETIPLVFHMMFTRSDQGERLLAAVNEGLKQLKDDGKYNEIFKKYGVSVK